VKEPPFGPLHRIQPGGNDPRREGERERARNVETDRKYECGVLAGLNHINTLIG